MGSFSIWHWLIVLAVVLLLFGGSSKISTLMGDFAKGIKSFKKNMGDDESMEAGAPSHGSLAAPGTVGPQVAPTYAAQPYAPAQPQPAYPSAAHAAAPYPAPQPGQPVTTSPVTGTAVPVEPQHRPG